MRPLVTACSVVLSLLVAATGIAPPLRAAQPGHGAQALPGAQPPAEAPAPAAARPPSRPPNIVVILADDLGWGDVCAYGCERGRTPSIDALAASGARFTQAYVTAPQCSPSRAALLTGRYQQRFGHERNPGRDGGGTPASERLLPEYLKSSGYATGLVGKWHLGSRPELHPQARGFDEFFGFLHAANLYIDPDAPGVHFVERSAHGGPLRRDPQNPIYRGREPVNEPSYLTEALTREAVSFIERHRSRPFFLYVAYGAPHVPLQVTDRYYDRFPEVEDEGERIYTAMVSALDDGVGAIVAALERAGLSESTLVVFASDNGCATYTAACSNGPLLGGKVTLFEGGVRVPFIASWPATIPPARVIDAPISTLDVVPTALAMAGAARSPDRALDGEDLLPLLRGEATALGRDRLFWRNGSSHAVRAGPWKLVRHGAGEPFLFDLEHDVAESRNLARAKPERVDELERLYRSWESGMVPPLWPGRQPLFAALDDILARRPMKLLDEPAPGTIEIEF